MQNEKKPLSRSQIYYRDNKDHHNEVTRAYYTNNKEDVDRKQRERYYADPEVTRQKRQEYYQKNKARMSARNNDWKRRNPDKVRQMHVEYYAKNKEAILERSKIYNQNNKKQVNKRQGVWRLKRTLASFGMTLDDYQRVLTRQKGLCAICQSPPREGRRLHIDHCHLENIFRGLLCDRCNWAMGKFGDDPDLLLKVRMYLIVTKANAHFSYEVAA